MSSHNKNPMLNLKFIRIKKGLTQGELARKIGVCQNTISFYETGSRFPRRDILSKLAEALGCEVKDLL